MGKPSVAHAFCAFVFVFVFFGSGDLPEALRTWRNQNKQRLCPCTAKLWLSCK